MHACTIYVCVIYLYPLMKIRHTFTISVQHEYSPFYSPYSSSTVACGKVGRGKVGTQCLVLMEVFNATALCVGVPIFKYINVVRNFGWGHGLETEFAIDIRRLQSCEVWSHTQV